MDQNMWMNDNRLNILDKTKLDFLQNIIFDMNNLEQDEKLPFLMALASSKSFQKLSFTHEEIAVLTDVIKDYSSNDDYQRAIQLLSLFHKQ